MITKLPTHHLVSVQNFVQGQLLYTYARSSICQEKTLVYMSSRPWDRRQSHRLEHQVSVRWNVGDPEAL